MMFMIRPASVKPASILWRTPLTTDRGMAPCVDGGLLSLATCKPKIRSSAEPGDWVLGFYPAPSPPGLVAWAARVSQSLPVGDYQSEFPRRSDAVYRLLGNGSYKRLRPDYHPTEKELCKDVSAPVLLFHPAETWYFGNSPRPLPACLAHLAPSGRGHRVNGVADGDLVRLAAWLKAWGPPGMHAPPRHPPLPKIPLGSC
jgi:hypothetical protein